MWTFMFMVLILLQIEIKSHVKKKTLLVYQVKKIIQKAFLIITLTWFSRHLQEK